MLPLPVKHRRNPEEVSRLVVFVYFYLLDGSTTQTSETMNYI